MITIDQETGEFYLIGNTSGLEYLRDSIDKSLEMHDIKPEEIQLKLDREITGDLKEIIAGNEAIHSALEMSEFYNSASPKLGSDTLKKKLVRFFLGSLKIIWWYILPVLGLYAIYYFIRHA